MDEAAIIGQRRAIAVAWGVTAAMVAIGGLAGIPQLILTTWLLVLVLLVVTSRRNHAEREERLERPRLYRALAGAVVGLAVAGCVAALSSGNDLELLLPLFAGIAVFGYRALVARGPRPALWLAVLTSFGWLWGAVLLLASHGCKCPDHGVDRGTATSVLQAILVVELALIAALVAVTLIAFRRRIGDLPDARIV